MPIFFLHHPGELCAAEHFIAVRAQRAHCAVFFEYVVQVKGAAVAVNHHCTIIFSLRFLQPLFHGRSYLIRYKVEFGVNCFEFGIPAVFADNRLDLRAQGGAGNE